MLTLPLRPPETPKAGPETCDGDPAPPSEPQAAQAGSRSPRAPSPAPLAQGHHGPGGREEGPGHVRGVMTALPASQAPTGHQLPRLGPALPLCCPRHTPAQPCPTPFQSRAPQSWNPHHISPATHLLPPPLLCIHLLNHSQSTRTPAPNASPPPAGLPCCSEPGFCGACLGPSPETQPLHGTVPGLGTEHLPGALCSGTGSPASPRADRDHPCPGHPVADPVLGTFAASSP